MFQTKYERYVDHDHVYCEPGSGIKIEYQLRIIDNNEDLVETGKSNLYDYIQSHADSVDITKILERCALLDDYSLLNRLPAQFMDVTDMPKNLAECYSYVQDAKNFFERMPTEIKAKYDQNFLSFISDIGSDRFNNTVRDFLDSIKEKEINEVKDES